MSQSELFNASDYDHNNYNTKEDLYFDEKVQHEIHRMMGLLRFTPDETGTFIARCAPDYFILPALGDYFTERFGETAWAIIDEKRALRLYRQPPNEVKLVKQDTLEDTPLEKDEWEDLWKHYHKIINNESRNNPDLQRQLMPKRYWKYLPEV